MGGFEMYIDLYRSHFDNPFITIPNETPMSILSYMSFPF